MTDTATPELPAELQEKLEGIAQTTKKGFDLKARLEGRGLRKGTITLYLDEELGVDVGWAFDVERETPFGKREFVRRERGGVIGQLDEVVTALSNAQKQYDDAMEGEDLSASDKKKLTAAFNSIREGFETRITELEEKKAELLERLTKTGITIKMRAVPPVIAKDCRRKAKATLGIETKNVPEDRMDEFKEVQAAHLMTVIFQRVIDNETGAVNETTTYEDGKALIDLLPPSQFDRLDFKMGEIQYMDAISREIENQEDFS
jgi:hypothetical protein